jgi:hypothetical protein
MRKVHLWHVGALCIACGLVSLIVLRIQGPHRERGWSIEPFLLAFWFGSGTIFLAVPLLRRAYTPGNPQLGELVGCAACGFAAVVIYLFLIALSF